MANRRWANTELEVGYEADGFVAFLKQNNIKYEASENEDMIRFCFLINKEEEQAVIRYLGTKPCEAKSEIMGWKEKIVFGMRLICDGCSGSSSCLECPFAHYCTSNYGDGNPADYWRESDMSLGQLEVGDGN